MFGVLVLVFFMIRVSGDPAAMMMPRESSPEDIEAFREAMGFNRPLIVQAADFMTGAIRGDFGDSLHYRSPALLLVLERLPATMQLAATGLLMAAVIGIPLGLIGGFSPGSFADTLARAVGLFMQSVPNFWLGLVMILFFAVRMGWFPSCGRDQWNSVVMPAFILSTFTLGQIVRLTRSAVLEVRSEDYIRTAHSKGLDPPVIYIKHVLRNVAIPLVSVLGVNFGYMLGGSIYIETIFAWPGIGQLTERAIGWRDFPLVQAIAVFVSMVVLALNLLTDLAYVVIDPRIRYE